MITIPRQTRLVVVKQNILLLFFLAISSCGVFVPEDEEFTFQKTSYSGNEIRLDGYYFNRFPSSSSNGDSLDRIKILFFYQNGVTLSGSSPTVSELPQLEENFRNGQYYRISRNNQTDWGIFRLDSSGKIVHERKSNPNGTLLVFRDSLRIISDTLLEDISSERIDGSDLKRHSIVYQFKAFSTKPDSIVDYIH